MAITHVNTTLTSGAAGTTSLVLTYPGSLAADDLILGGRASKLNTVTNTALTGWTKIAELAGGTGASAADAGSTIICCDRKDTVAGSESGTVSFTQANSPISVAGGMIALRHGSGMSWDVAVATGNDGTHGTGRGVTASTSISIQSGDWIVAVIVSDTDDATAFTSPAISATGMTITTTLRGRGVSTTGTDSGCYFYTGAVTAGTLATVAPALSLTGGPSSCGPVAFIRVREVSAPDVYGTAAAALSFGATGAGTVTVAPGTTAVASSAENVGGWHTTGTSETVTGVAWNTGDVVVVVGGAENADSTAIFATPTNANLSFTSRAANTSGGANETSSGLWTAVAGSSQTGQTITATCTSSSTQHGIAVFVIAGASGSFANATSNLNESADTITTTAGSTVIVAMFDWQATAGARTLTTASGTSAVLESSGDAASYGIHIGSWSNVSAGSQSFGWTSYASTTASTVLIEVLATPAGGDVNGFAAAAFSESAVVVGSPAGSALAARTWSAVCAGTVTIPEVNGAAVASGVWTATVVGQAAVAGSALAARSWVGVAQGGVAGVESELLTWSASAVGAPAVQGSASAVHSYSATAAGGPSGAATVGFVWGVSGAGTTGSDQNGAASVPMAWNAATQGGPGGVATRPVAFSAVVTPQVAVQGSAAAGFGWNAAVSGVVGVNGAVLTPLVWSAVTAGSPAGQAGVHPVWTTTAIGQPAVQGAAVASRAFGAAASGGAAGNAGVSAGFLAVGTGSGSGADANGVASASFGWNAATSGLPAVQGAAGAPFAFASTVIGQLSGSAATIFAWSAASSGVVGLSGVVAAPFGGVAAVVGTPTVVGTAAASRTWAASSTGGPGGSAVGSLVWNAGAQGRTDVVGQALGAWAWGVSATGDAAGGGSLGVLAGTSRWHVRPEGHGPSDGVADTRRLPVRADRHDSLVPPRGRPTAAGRNRPVVSCAHAVAELTSPSLVSPGDGPVRVGWLPRRYAFRLGAGKVRGSSSSCHGGMCSRTCPTSGRRRDPPPILDGSRPRS